MRLDGRLITVFFIALAFIPGACAMKTSISGGTSTSVIGSAQGYTMVDDNGAESMTDVNGILYLNENTLIDFDGVHVTTNSIMTPEGIDPSYSISQNGNAAKVWWDFKTKPGTTIFSQKSTYGKPYSSTYGYGVSEDLALSVNNAYWILAGSSSSNNEGDSATVEAWVGSDVSSIPSASIKNYYTKAYAYSKIVDAYETASSVIDASQLSSLPSATGQISFKGWAQNLEGDYASAGEVASVNDCDGSHVLTFTNPTIHSYSSKTNSNVKLTGSVFTTGKGTLDAYASNKEGDSATFRFDMNFKYPNFQSGTGTITGADLSVLSQKNLATTTAKISNAYGSDVLITSTVFGKIKGMENNPNVAGRPLTGISDGRGTFSALRTNNNPFTNVFVESKANVNDVSIKATGFGTKTALLLDPRRWEFVTAVNGIDFRNPTTNALLSKGYAVTYYSDAAVSKAKVLTMDDYWVSVLLSHGGPAGMELSTTTNGITEDIISFSTLQSGYTKKNGMALLLGCQSFDPDKDGVRQGANAVKLATFSGGIQGTWPVGYVQLFVNDFFSSMASGSTAAQANRAAGFSDPTDGKYKSLSLQGATNFVL